MPRLENKSCRFRLRDTFAQCWQHLYCGDDNLLTSKSTSVINLSGHKTLIHISFSTGQLQCVNADFRIYMPCSIAFFDKEIVESSFRRSSQLFSNAPFRIIPNFSSCPFLPIGRGLTPTNLVSPVLHEVISFSQYAFMCFWFVGE